VVQNLQDGKARPLVLGERICKGKQKTHKHRNNIIITTTKKKKEGEAQNQGREEGRKEAK
jgi:hypothetical protein